MTRPRRPQHLRLVWTAPEPVLTVEQRAEQRRLQAVWEEFLTSGIGRGKPAPPDFTPPGAA
ncbi:MAG: hypothetical protein WKG00_17795 [Polyangiaceae bacterium]